MEDPRIEARRQVWWLYETLLPSSPIRPTGPDRQERDAAVTVRGTGFPEGHAPACGGLAEWGLRTRRQFPAGSAPERTHVAPYRAASSELLDDRGSAAAADRSWAEQVSAHAGPLTVVPAGFEGEPSDGVQIDWP